MTTMQTTEPAQLTRDEADELADHESVIEQSQALFIEVGNSLMAIRDAKLYRATHASFEQYLAERWPAISKRRGYQLIDAAAIAKDVPITNERQARALKNVPVEQAKQAYAAASVATNGAPTAKAIQAAADSLKLPSDFPAYEAKALACGLRLVRDGSYYVTGAPDGTRESSQWSVVKSFLDASEQTYQLQAQALAATAFASKSATRSDPHAGWKRIATATESHAWIADGASVDGYREALCGKRTQSKLADHLGHGFCRACEIAQSRPVAPVVAMPQAPDSTLTPEEQALLLANGWTPAKGYTSENGFALLGFSYRGGKPVIEVAAYWRRVIRNIGNRTPGTNDDYAAIVAEEALPSQDLISARRYQSKLTSGMHNLEQPKDRQQVRQLCADLLDCLNTIDGLPSVFEKAVEAVLTSAADMLSDRQHQELTARLEGVVTQ